MASVTKQNSLIALLDQVVNYIQLKAGCIELPVDLDRIARHLNVREIRVEDVAPEGYVEQQDDGAFRIVLRRDRSMQRRNFSLAHELGHIIINKIIARPHWGLSRKYRTASAVAQKLDEEAIADYLAGMLLIPSWAIGQRLPESFSMREIVKLADDSHASVPTALIRSLWFATHPCFAFHVRMYDRKADNFRCMWTRASRSLSEPPSADEATTLIAKSNSLPILTADLSTRFHTAHVADARVRSIELYRRHFDSRDFIYGLARLEDDYAESETNLLSSFS